MTIGTTSRVVKVQYIHDGTTSGRDVYIEDYGRRWIKTNYTKETSPTGVLVGYIQSDGNIHMFVRPNLEWCTDGAHLNL